MSNYELQCHCYQGSVCAMLSIVEVENKDCPTLTIEFFEFFPVKAGDFFPVAGLIYEEWKLDWRQSILLVPKKLGYSLRKTLYMIIDGEQYSCSGSLALTYERLSELFANNRLFSLEKED